MHERTELTAGQTTTICWSKPRFADSAEYCDEKEGRKKGMRRDGILLYLYYGYSEAAKPSRVRQE